MVFQAGVPGDEQRQQGSACCEAQIAKDIRGDSKLAQSMLDGNLRDAGNRHHSGVSAQKLPGFGPQAWIVEEPPEHQLDIEQQAA